MTKINCARVYYTITITGSVGLHHVDEVLTEDFCEDKLRRKFHKVLQHPDHGVSWIIKEEDIGVSIDTIEYFAVDSPK